MDLNELYFDHQVAVMRADGARSREYRHDHRFDASLIAGRIGCMQRALGAGAERRHGKRSPRATPPISRLVRWLCTRLAGAKTRRMP